MFFKLSLILCLSISLLGNSETKVKSGSVPKSCSDWFSKSKVKDSKDCSLQCAMAGSDMSSFDCSRFCDLLCKQMSDGLGFSISGIYPGLTDAEKKFVDRNPSTAAKAYLLSWNAESSCKSIYFKSDTNDESDACRHFMWAALLNEAFGESIASQILDAHEKNDLEPEQEKAMDLANNRRGILASTQILNEKKASTKVFLDQFKKDLEEGKLIVLKRRKK